MKFVDRTNTCLLSKRALQQAHLQVVGRYHKDVVEIDLPPFSLFIDIIALPELTGDFLNDRDFFIASLAELERIPFDLPEADTELVAGWVTEYTGMGFGAVFLGIYIKLYALSGLFTAFFLGGWLGPSFLPPEFWFILKTFFVMTAMLIPRGTMPRIRIDLMIRAGWTRLLVLSFANIFLTMLLVSLGIFRIGAL